MIAELLKTNTKLRSILFYFSALFCGLLLPFAFAPYDQSWLLYPLLTGLFLMLVEQTPAQAFKRAFWFGLGWFAHGVHWIYYSLHYHGGAPALMASVMVLLLAAYLALFPATVLAAGRRWFKLSASKQLVLLFPLLWVLAEWLRGTVLTGFPWLQLGYSQIDTPLAGYVPLLGGLGLTYLVALSCGLLAVLVYKRRLVQSLAVLASIWLLGYGLMPIDWTEKTGEPVRVSLIQGNIAQSDKWQRHMRQPTLDMYRELTRQHWDSDVIIWPETAVPDYQFRVRPYLAELKREANGHDVDVLLGLFIRDQNKRRYYNSVINLRDGVYKKRHLVPLGEYYPFRSLLTFFSRWIKIPMSDVDSGPERQPLVEMAGQTVGISICFEDVFDRDVRKDLPEARLLINVSNDAWFEDSPEAWQHHQIARMRALETGRYMLRATNTGVSSVIDASGQVQAIAPQFERYVLSAEVQPLMGRTPYVMWGNYLLISLVVSVLVLVRVLTVNNTGRSQ